jgi:hypothetical protein
MASKVKKSGAARKRLDSIVMSASAGAATLALGLGLALVSENPAMASANCIEGFWGCNAIFSSCNLFKFPDQNDMGCDYGCGCTTTCSVFGGCNGNCYGCWYSCDLSGPFCFHHY